ncbi:hypothetical protein SDC9_148207 [bioreactor metagenome]|uniref:Uncharacterized protein n=1 Tax=bioreactor metagenome TaxID=1076179 RepID=A0A645EG76_9ZZZZ
MPRVGKTNVNPIVERKLLIVGMRNKELERALRVLHGIERNIGGFAAARALAVSPFCFKLLNVRAVAEHDVAEVAGGLRCVNGPAKAVLIKQRQ